MTTLPVRPSAGIGDTLASMADTLLSITISCLQSAGLVVPSRQVVYLSPIPADCEQVAVLFSGWTPTPLQEGMTACSMYRWAGQFSVLVTRCTPALPKKSRGNDVLPPEPADMTAAAIMASADADALICVLHRIGEHANAQIITSAPSGGLQTVVLEVQVPVG